MIIIGEKINGSRPTVADAITRRDDDAIRRLARAQVEAGSDYLDVNAGTEMPEREPESLQWLVETVQKEVDVPLCLDTASPAALRAALQVVAKTPLINSISGETARLSEMLPLAAAHGCPVILLALDDGGVPKGVEGRMRVINELRSASLRVGLHDEQLFIDPLIVAISTDDQQANIALETIRCVRSELPAAHVTGGLSNVSYGVPGRSLINQAFMVLAIEAGLDCAITDPTRRELLGTVLAAEALLGRDRFCRRYNSAFRAGRIGSQTAPPGHRHCDGDRCRS